jgi:hypothetical protein
MRYAAAPARWNDSVMTVEQLKNVHAARPFRPFTVHMGDGRSFRVEHPDFLSRSQSGLTIIVHQPDESYSVLDMLLVAEFEVHPPAPPSREVAA